MAPQRPATSPEAMWATQTESLRYYPKFSSSRTCFVHFDGTRCTCEPQQTTSYAMATVGGRICPRNLRINRARFRAQHCHGVSVPSWSPIRCAGLVRTRIRLYMSCLLFGREITRSWWRYVRVQPRCGVLSCGDASSLIDHVVLIHCWQYSYERLSPSPELRSLRNDMRRDFLGLGIADAS